MATNAERLVGRRLTPDPAVVTTRAVEPARARRRSHGLRPASIAGVLLAVVAAAPPASADRWYEHYARAEEALKAERWSKAIKELNDAIERKGDSGARERSYGMKVMAYFPYLKLGIAYFHLGQYDAALQAFQTEERLGAIQGSESELAELNENRRLALAAKDRAAEAEAERIARIVQDALEQAHILEDEGRLTEAMGALGRALAVAPDNTLAVTGMERLRNEVARRQRERDDEVRAAKLVADGRSALDNRDFASAASLLRQAQAMRPSPETAVLLARAQDGLRGSLGGDGQGRRDLAERSLAAARELEANGHLDEALDRLQPLLAVEPANTDAVGLLKRLLDAKDARDRQQAVDRALFEADSEFAAGRFENALAAANRALGLDSGNEAALEHVRNAYREISRRLLGARSSENIPPAIRFADFREVSSDGLRVQRLDRPDFVLTGVAIDDSPVRIVFFDDQGRQLAATVTSQPAGDFVITEFGLHRHVATGPSTFRLVATDAAGLSTSAEYAVVYFRPFARSPWLALVLALGPLTAAAVLYARHVRRRRRLLRRKFNPYVAGAPVLDRRLFVGRDQLVERVLQTIHNNSLLLFGERRIGKTSLLHHIKRRLHELDDPVFAFYPILVDLQGTREERFFATVMEDILQELGRELNSTELGEALRSGEDYGFRAFVADLRAVLEALEEKGPKQVKLVLLIDEVDELNAYDPRINQRLRSLFMKSFAEKLVAVVSGVEIRKQWEKEGSPWYNFFEEIEIGAIDREAAAALIIRPIRGVFAVEEGVVERIVEMTECKPYMIQRTCVALVNRLHEEGRRTVTLADVEALGQGPNR
jgi:tetratricopeptide (TPR) repeat protein